MKKWIALVCMLLLPPITALGGQALPRIGLLVYDGTDTFMHAVCARIQQAGAEKADILFVDSANSQITQNDQVEQLLRKGIDVLILNPVDRTAAVYLLRMAHAYGVPVVCINREPVYEDLALYENVYYVGSDPKESGTMSGELIAEYFSAHPQADKNGDGVIQYVMLKGEPGHQDATLRTAYSVQAIQRAGFVMENLVEESAMWQRAIAQERMSHIIASYGERIECVIANNDEMALGAIEALKAAGFFTEDRFLPVVGVDATSHAIAALKEGTLLGTVLNDGENMGDAATQLALLLAKKEPINAQTFAYPIEQGIYVWIPGRKVTAATLP